MDFDVENMQRLLDLEDEITISGKNIVLELAMQNNENIIGHVKEAMITGLMQAIFPFLDYYYRPEEELKYQNPTKLASMYIMALPLAFQFILNFTLFNGLANLFR